MAVDLSALREELNGLGLSLRGVLPTDLTQVDTGVLPKSVLRWVKVSNKSGDVSISRSGGHLDATDKAFDGDLSLLIIGNEGDSLWRSERGGYRERHISDGDAKADAKDRSLAGDHGVAAELHRLDNWTRAVIDPIAARYGGVALYPFGGPPWHPFQQWAMAVEPVMPSPIGMLVHPDFGLWHAYRAAILVAEKIVAGPKDNRESPCLTCADMPCLSSCPVDAFRDMRKEDGYYDVSSCADHIATQEGCDCLTRGCRARRSCPIGQGYFYAPGQAEFHMRAFLRARGN